MLFPWARCAAWLLFAALASAGCDQATEEEAPASAEGSQSVHADASVAAGGAVKLEAKAKGGVIAKDQLDLAAVSMMVEKGMVKDAKALEKTLNDPKKKFHSIDIDGDGELDKIAVVELRDKTESRFELRVIPSTAKKKEKADAAVTVAIITFVPNEETSKVEVAVTYTEVVVHEPADAVHFEVDVNISETAVVVEDNTFVAWVYKPSRKVYVSVEVDAYVEVEVVEGCWPPGHCKHVHVHHDYSPTFSVHIDGGHHHHKHKHHKFKHHRGRH
ncbi:MAG: hypothetical protein KC636_15215 [Myxococcales bacterium]|nr:hypothetical protein [Myxococcales bacterium]